jgi:hypothetical protein
VISGAFNNKSVHFVGVIILCYMASDDRAQPTCTTEPCFGLIHFTVTKSVPNETVEYAAKSEKTLPVSNGRLSHRY